MGKASVLLRGFAVALGLVQAIAEAACSDCEVGEETALLQHTLSTEHEHTIEDARPKHGQKDSCEKEVMATQRAWKEAIMDISAAYREDGENSKYVQIAEHAIHELYGYDVRPVMFKPTQAVQDPFRPHFIGALSYFVGYGPTKKKGGFKEDKGFAIAGGDTWSKVLFFNDEVTCVGDLALAQGYYYFTNDKTGAETGVEYTFVYEKVKGDWKIVVHHSSLPYPISIPTSTAHLLQENTTTLAAAKLQHTWRKHRHHKKSACEVEVDATQRAWKEAIMDISAAYREDGESSKYVQIAEHAIHELYGYDVAPVMFKPTQAVQDPFRPHFIGALSYFVGYGPTKKEGGFKEDKGFAIAGGDTWSKVLFFNDQVTCTGDVAIAQGYYYFTNDKTGAETGVEYSFVYQKVKGDWRIVVHHSSIPYPL